MTAHCTPQKPQYSQVLTQQSTEFESPSAPADQAPGIGLLRRCAMRVTQVAGAPYLKIIAGAMIVIGFGTSLLGFGFIIGCVGAGLWVASTGASCINDAGRAPGERTGRISVILESVGWAAIGSLLLIPYWIAGCPTRSAQDRDDLRSTASSPAPAPGDDGRSLHPSPAGVPGDDGCSSPLNPAHVLRKDCQATSPDQGQGPFSPRQGIWATEARSPDPADTPTPVPPPATQQKNAGYSDWENPTLWWNQSEATGQRQ